MMKEVDLESVTTWIGSGVLRFYLPLNQVFPQSNVSQVILLPKDLAARERLRAQLPTLLAAEFGEARTRVKVLPNGPPVNYPVQFRVMGPDAKLIGQAADQVKALLRAHPSRRSVNDNWNEQIKVLHLDIDQDKARAGHHQPGHCAVFAQRPERHNCRPVPRG